MADDDKKDDGVYGGKYADVEALEKAHSGLEGMLGDFGRIKHAMKEAKVKTIDDVIGLVSAAPEVTKSNGKTDKEPSDNGFGVFRDRIAGEFRSLGGISEDTMKELGTQIGEVFGVGETMGGDIASSLRDTMNSRSSKLIEGIRESVGDGVNPRSLMAWANENLDEGRLAVYQEMLDEGDMGVFKSVKDRYDKWAEDNPKQAEKHEAAFKNEPSTTEPPKKADATKAETTESEPEKPAALETPTTTPVKKGRPTMTDETPTEETGPKPYGDVDDYDRDIQSNQMQDVGFRTKVRERLEASPQEIQAQANAPVWGGEGSEP